MEKRRMPYYSFHLRVDDKGRLKLPPEIREALGGKCEMAIVSDARQIVRMYPLNTAVSRRIVVGRRLTTIGLYATYAHLTLAAERPDTALSLEARMVCFVTSIDAQGRVVIAPHQSGQPSDVELENEE